MGMHISIPTHCQQCLAISRAGMSHQQGEKRAPGVAPKALAKAKSISDKGDPESIWLEKSRRLLTMDIAALLFKIKKGESARPRARSKCILAKTEAQKGRKTKKREPLGCLSEQQSGETCGRGT